MHYPRNLVAFHYNGDLDVEQLDEALRVAALVPIGPNEMSRTGFVSPFGPDSEAFTHVARFVMRHTPYGEAAEASVPIHLVRIQLGTYSRLIAPGAVDAATEKRIKEVEERDGLTLGARARKALRQEVLNQMIPTVYPSFVISTAYIDLANKIVWVDTSSPKAAEAFVTSIRRALGSFPTFHLRPDRLPSSVLTEWVLSDGLPPGLRLGHDAELHDPVENGAIARLQRQNLAAEEALTHLHAGKIAKRLSLAYADRFTFVIDDKLIIRKLSFTDPAEGEVQSDHENIEDGQLYILAADLFHLHQVLDAAFAIQEGHAKFSGSAAAVEPTASNQAPEVSAAEAQPPRKALEQQSLALDLT